MSDFIDHFLVIGSFLLICLAIYKLLVGDVFTGVVFGLSSVFMYFLDDALCH